MAAFPMFPLSSVLLPGGRLPLHIFEPRYREMVRHCLDAPDGPRFGVVLIARGKETGGGEVRHDVATVARIVDALQLRDGRYALDCVGQERVRVTRWLEDNPFPQGEVEPWPDHGDDGDDLDVAPLRTLTARVHDLTVTLARQRGVAAPPDLWFGLPDNPARLLYRLADRMPLGEADRYAVLSAAGLQERLAVLTDAVTGVVELLEFELTDRN